jgi:glycosyltransferase involved in cell wall biosynthesis
MTSRVASCAVVYRRKRRDIDAIDAYSRRLVDAVGSLGCEMSYYADGVPPAFDGASRSAWVVLQYQPFAYGRWGFAPRLVFDVRRLLDHRRTRLALIVHEAWVDIVDWRSALMGVWQRVQLRGLLQLADAVMTSTEALADEIGGGALHLPVASNIDPVAMTPAAARDLLGLEGRLVIGLFGRGHPSRALNHAEAAINALVDAHGKDGITVLNLGAGAPPLQVPSAVNVRSPGGLSPEELSVHLWAVDLALLPFTDGVSTRRTTLMAALAHGRPVLAVSGKRTDAVLRAAQDALVLTPVGDTAAFAQAAVALSKEPQQLQAIGQAGRRLYEARFDWPALADRVMETLEAVTPTRRRQPQKGIAVR